MINNLPALIFICGFMGTGKTTVGRELAEKLSLSFLDLDEEIEREAGKSIAEIFEDEGESAFRKMERDTLLEVIRNFKGVVALGGGTLQNQHIVDHIKVNGLLIFIETPFSVIFQRIMNEPHRPLLLNEEGSLKKKEILKKQLNSLYRKRLPFYEQAELKITGEEAGAKEDVVERLLKKIRYHVSHY